MVCRTGGAADGDWSNRRLGAGIGRGQSLQPSGIVESRRVECGGGDERTGTFEEGAGADEANPLRAAVH